MKTLVSNGYDSVLVVFPDLITETKLGEFKIFAIQQIIGAQKVLVIINESQNTKILKEIEGMFKKHFEERITMRGEVVISDNPLAYFSVVVDSELEKTPNRRDCQYRVVCDFSQKDEIGAWADEFTKKFIVPRPVSMAAFNTGMAPDIKWEEKQCIWVYLGQIWLYLTEIMKVIRKIYIFNFTSTKSMVVEE